MGRHAVYLCFVAGVLCGRAPRPQQSIFAASPLVRGLSMGADERLLPFYDNDADYSWAGDGCDDNSMHGPAPTRRRVILVDSVAPSAVFDDALGGPPSSYEPHRDGSACTRRHRAAGGPMPGNAFGDHDNEDPDVDEDECTHPADGDDDDDDDEDDEDDDDDDDVHVLFKHVEDTSPSSQPSPPPRI